VKSNSRAPLLLNEAVEISPGYIVERRSVLAGLGALLLAQLALPSRAATLSFADFLAEANPLARELVTDASAEGQDRYLKSIAALAAQLDAVPLPEAFNPTNQGQTPESYRIGFNPGGDPFTVLHWRLEPGAVCRPHAHTYGNVVSLGLEGLVRVSNFEVVGTPDYAEPGTFRVRQTMDQVLGRGDVNLVSLDRNYIHGFVAGPDGARGLDITTRLRPRPDHGTPFLDIGAVPIDDFLRTYDASWIYYD
jgi:hypothetical protein